MHFFVRAPAQNALFRRVRFSSPGQTSSHLTEKRTLELVPHGKAHSGGATLTVDVRIARIFIEFVDGRWVAHKAKTGDKKVPGAIASLKRRHDKIVGDNSKACIRSPAFMGVLTVTSLYAREVEEDIYVIPIRSLAP